MCGRRREISPALWLETDLQSGETAEVFSRLCGPKEPAFAAAAVASEPTRCRYCEKQRGEWLKLFPNRAARNERTSYNYYNVARMGDERGAYRVLVGRPDGKRPLGRPRRRWSWSGRPARPTALLPPRSNGKTRGCYCSCWAADDGREDARNTLSCT